MTYLQILLIAAVVVVVIARRFAGAPVRARPLVLPVGLSVYGAVLLRGQHIGLTDVVFLAVELVLAFGVGPCGVPPSGCTSTTATSGSGTSGPRWPPGSVPSRCGSGWPWAG